MPDSRRVAILTTGRQDYGLLRSTLLQMDDDGRLSRRLWVAGMHLNARFGQTIKLIRDDHITIDREVAFVGEPPDPLLDASRALIEMGRALEADRPAALLLTGDRSETLAAGVAATLVRVPIAHLHGGEETEGAIDNVCRHALTKLSHLHLVSHETHARRVAQMGEDPTNIVVVGAPGLDNMYRQDLPDRTTLAGVLSMPLLPPLVLVTVHPTTLGDDPLLEVRSIAAAMENVEATYVVTQPNADVGGEVIRDFWIGWSRGRARVQALDALGVRMYWGLLKIVDAVLGNSSSGIIEAPAVGVPAVNVGDRQRGRLRHPATLDVPPTAHAVEQGLRWALDRDTRERVRQIPSPYPPGPAAPRIVEALARWQPPVPPRKRFCDLL